MPYRPYLTFAGNCREAFTRYHQIFGGDLVLLTFDDVPAEAGGPPPGVAKDAVMHGALMAGGDVLMGADDTGGNFKGNVHGMCVNWSTQDVAEAKRVFSEMSKGGTVQQPITETFFSPAFGMCIDTFGTPWMIMADMPTEG